MGEKFFHKSGFKVVTVIKCCGVGVRSVEVLARGCCRCFLPISDVAIGCKGLAYMRTLRL